MKPMTRVTDRPVARNTDPVQSFEAGDDVAAVRGSVAEVLAIVEAAGKPVTAFDIERLHEYRATHENSDRRWTGSRLRTAAARLVDEGLLAHGPMTVSPNGRRCHTFVKAGE